jgi:hypothetical protein
MSDPIQDFKDGLAIAATGMTKSQAHAEGICIACKKPISQHGPSSDAGIREYQITGIYGDECWDAFLGPEPE